VRIIPVALLSLAPLFAQTVTIQVTGVAEIPTLVDGNSPSFWLGDEFRFFTSTGPHPVLLRGGDHYTLGAAVPIAIEPSDHYPMWIEAVWPDQDGTLFGWYHQEPEGSCRSGELTAPQIGAVVSLDNGETWTDLGIVLTSGGEIDCSAGNGLFAGGNGDFSVILDRSGEFFYFLFTNYGGPAAGQGVAVARLHYADRWNPSGNVFKYHNNEWNEPGLGGAVTPIFAARSSWVRRDTDSFWGPSVHWNTHLQQYVLLLNRSCCEPRWPQEGIYATFNPDISDPGGWTVPSRILPGGAIGWRAGYYPQVMGEWPDGTDRQAGERVRLYVSGKSRWMLQFSH
jgi:hypothetical protein